MKPVNCGCGGEANAYFSVANGATVCCSKCNITLTGYISQQRAISAWNRAMSADLREAAYRISYAFEKSGTVSNSDGEIDALQAALKGGKA